MTASELPYSRIFDLGCLSDAGEEVRIVPGEAERARIAQWAGLDRLDSLTAAVDLKRRSATRFAIEGSFAADVVQTCVVSLAPVQSHLEGAFRRELIVAAAPGNRPERRTVTLGPDAEEEPETIDSRDYDLAGPLLEELVLRIDPYPRASDARFEVPSGAADRPESPFSVLGRLKGEE